MLDNINQNESYFGEVVDISDNKQASRIKVRVVSVYDLLETEDIPWAIPRYVDGQSHDLPALGETVQIKFLNNDVQFPTWYRIRKHSESLSKEDYESGSILIEKDLSKYNLDGSLSVRYTQSEGLLLELTRNNNTSTFIIRNDNTVFAKNGNTGRIVHISNESISIGSETKSQQPCTVGDDNVQALNHLNDTIDKLKSLMDKHLKILAKVAGSNPYTKLLEPPLKTYGLEVNQQLTQLHTRNKSFFPETLSLIATVDKT